MSHNELIRIKKTINKCFDTIHIKSIESIGEGWRNKAYLINDRYIFRFPKEKRGAIDLEKEINVLPKINNHISISIPQFEYIGKQDNGFSFVGYKILNGTPMDYEVFNTLSTSSRDKLAKRVAKFIIELSTYPIDLLFNCDIPFIDYYNEFKELFEVTKVKVFPILDNDIREFIFTRFDLYLKNKENFEYTPTLLHADISLDHLIFDAESEELVGIIDFGDMVIGDPDYEYIYLLDDCGEEFARKVLEINNSKDIEKTVDKVKFLLLIDNIRLIQEGINRGNEEMIKNAVCELKKDMMSSR